MIMFHVKLDIVLLKNLNHLMRGYLPNNTRSTLMSLGLTPGIRLA